MSDERTSPTPNPPRCPVCASGFTATPGASCPACGRVFAPMPASLPEHDFRLRTERRRLDGPGWMVTGLVLSCCGLLLAGGAKGPLILLAIFVVPALIRTVRLRSTNARGPLLVTFLAALGVSLLTGVAAGVAFFGVCLAIASIGPGFTMLDRGFVAGGVAALVVFTGLFVALWPRADSSSKYDPGED